MKKKKANILLSLEAINLLDWHFYGSKQLHYQQFTYAVSSKCLVNKGGVVHDMECGMIVTSERSLQP